jgi:GTP-binding protein
MRTVAIVGRPNVGKSALFNRLAGKKISIVHDMPGVTRDRIVATCRQGRFPFQLVDTGGIGAGVDAEFSSQVAAEADIAMEASDLILFVVDAQAGLTPLDAEIARRLRKTSKPLFLVVNKVDHPNHSGLSNEFSRLGFSPIFAVSAEHGIGFDALIDRITAILPPSETPEPEDRHALPLKIAIVGRPNVGKSSLTNGILQDDRTLVSPISGTTRDSVDIPYTRGSQQYILIDTAGIRPKTKRSESVEVFSVMRSESSVERADLCCLVLDASQGVSSQDKRIAGMIRDQAKPCVIVINKIDLIPNRVKDKDGIREVLQEIRYDLSFLPYAPLVLLSAKTGEDLDRLFKRIENVRESSSRRIGTGPLNRLLTTAMTNHPPALRSGRRFKVLYSTQPEPRGRSPIPIPEVVLFCNDKSLLDDTYRRFLEARIREVEPWEGLPIDLHLRQREARGVARSRGGGGAKPSARGKGRTPEVIGPAEAVSASTSAASAQTRAARKSTAGLPPKPKRRAPARKGTQRKSRR